MRKTLLLLLTPIFAMCVLSFGNGFFTTFSAIELNTMGRGNFAIGIISAAYFMGMTAGPYFSQYTIVRIGYIRAFSLFASAMAISTLLLGIFKGVTAWIILRFVCGYSLAALFVVIESWCLLSADKKNRGTVFSIYLFVYYATQAFSQLMLNFHFSQTLFAYCFVSALCSISIIFMCFTKTRVPGPESEDVSSPFKIIKAVPLAMIAGFIGGAFLGSIYTMLPLFLVNIGGFEHTVSVVMMMAILGGVLLQIPIGKLSDIIDRRLVMLGISIMLGICSLAILLLSNSYWLFVLVMFIFGGGAFVVYPLAISHASDFLEEKQMIGAIGIITIFYGLGSVTGPFAIATLTGILGVYSFFMVTTVMAIILSVYITYRLFVRQKATGDDVANFILVSPESATFTEAQEVITDRLVD